MRTQRAEDEKAAKAAAKKGGGAKKPTGSAPRPAPAPAPAPSAGVTGDTSAGGATPATRYPTFEDLATERGWKRDAGDTVGGMGDEW